LLSPNRSINTTNGELNLIAHSSLITKTLYFVKNKKVVPFENGF
jgi:hypothetical protein